MNTQNLSKLEIEIRNIIDVCKIKTVGLNTKKIVFGNTSDNEMQEKNLNLFFRPEANEETLLSFNAGNKMMDYAYSSIIITTKKIWFRLMLLDNNNMVNGYIHGSIPLSEISSIALGNQYQTYFEIIINGDNIGYINTMINPTSDFEEFLDFVCHEISKFPSNNLNQSIFKYCTPIEVSTGVSAMNTIAKIITYASVVMLIVVFLQLCT